MSDLDRYLTDELVERTMRSLYAYEELESPFESLTRHDLGWLEGQARTVLSAVLPDIIQQAKAEALVDAADRLDLTGLERNSELSRWDYDSSDFYEELATEWLRDRADRIEHDARCPHPKCPGGGLCCCLPEQGGQL